MPGAFISANTVHGYVKLYVYGIHSNVRLNYCSTRTIFVCIVTGKFQTQIAPCITVGVITILQTCGKTLPLMVWSESAGNLSVGESRKSCQRNVTNDRWGFRLAPRAKSVFMVMQQLGVCLSRNSAGIVTVDAGENGTQTRWWGEVRNVAAAVIKWPYKGHCKNVLYSTRALCVRVTVSCKVLSHPFRDFYTFTLHLSMRKTVLK